MTRTEFYRRVQIVERELGALHPANTVEAKQALRELRDAYSRLLTDFESKDERAA